MKQLLLTTVIVVLLCSTAFGQMEEGDKEIQATGFITTSEGITFGVAQISYGYFIKSNIEIGVGPQFMFFQKSVLINAVFFGRYYFDTTEKTIYYLSGQWAQGDITGEYGGSLTDNAYVQGGVGLKHFVTENLAWDVSANLGFGLGGGGVAFTIIGGLSAFF